MLGFAHRHDWESIPAGFTVTELNVIMLALLSTWIGLLTFLLAAGMWIHRPFMTDPTVVAVLYFGAPGAMCLGGLVLWAHRKDPDADPGLAAQRVQSKTGIALALLAAAIVYYLIIASKKLNA